MVAGILEKSAFSQHYSTPKSSALQAEGDYPYTEANKGLLNEIQAMGKLGDGNNATR